jgi:hypothetical protein
MYVSSDKGIYGIGLQNREHGTLCFAAEEMQRGKRGPHNLRDRYIEFKKDEQQPF